MTRTLMMLTLAVVLLATAGHGQTPPGDRYLCYKAALAPKQPKFSSVQKTLEDQFGTLVADVKGFASLCNPVLSAQRPAVHQVGYKTTLAKARPAQKFVKSDHTAYDQFGNHLLKVMMPAELRAPSAKVLGAGGTGTVNTAGVDHFKCYKTGAQKGAPKFVATPVSITDQFGTLNLTLTKVTKLCAPVNKNGEDPTAPQHPGHLVCYQAKLPKGTKFPATTVSVNNTNFGPAVLVAKSVAELCVPALKDTIPTPASTQTPPPTPTRTPTPTATPVPTTEPLCGPGGTVSCVAPATCQGGHCVVPCGPITCAADEICCSSSSLNGICCDRNSQVCSQTQTSCVTEVCPMGTTYVPAIAGCCANMSLCGTEPGGAPADCCIFGIETCEAIDPVASPFSACVAR